MLRHRKSGVLVALFLSIWTAVAAAAPYAYITNSGALTVSVIDTATNSVASIPLSLNSPWGVAVDSSGTRVVVTHLLPAGKVSIIDTSANNVAAVLSVGAFPTGVAINPASTRAYVTNFGSTFLSIIDLTNNSVLGTVAGVGSGGRGAVFSTDGSRLYVARRVSMMGITVVNTATNTVEGTLPAGSGPAGIAILPNGSRLYTANEDDGTVTVVDPVNGMVEATITVGSAPLGMAIQADGLRAYATNSMSDTLSIIDTVAKTVIGEIPIGPRPYGVHVGPDGRVYVANRGSNTVSIFDPAMNTVSTVTVGSMPIAFGLFMQRQPAMYQWGGWKPPVAGGGALNPANAGSSISMRWTMSDANGTPISSLEAISAIENARLISCSGDSMSEVSAAASAGGTSLRYDASDQQYVFNWKTDKLWAGQCRAFIVRLADGTTRMAKFHFR